MKDFKKLPKMKTGGSVKKYEQGGPVFGMGVGQASEPMGVTAPASKYQPGRTPMDRIGYKAGGKTKKGC